MLVNHAQVSVRRMAPADRECFFGYYDKCPWSLDGSRVITGMTSVSGRLPAADELLEVGYLDSGDDASFQSIGETSTWNFQQGAMAQWLSLGGEEFILFNVRDNDRARAIWVDAAGRQRGSLEHAVYALSPDGRLAASIDYGRLHRLRPGYGYASARSQYTEVAAPAGDGMVLVEMASGAARLAVSYAELAEQVAPRGLDASHWIDHIEFGPDGRSLVFLHRWLASDGGPLTRLMGFDIETGALVCLLDCGSAGHGVWLDESHYGIWGRKGTLAAKARATSSSNSGMLRVAVGLARRLIPPALKGRIHQESFLVLGSGKESGSTALAQIPHGQRSGHPSLRPGGDWVVSDTLPDAKGGRLLFLASLDGCAFIPLATFVHDPATANSSFRCDLHPRWDRNGLAVCIDSLHEGVRGMYEIDVPDELLQGRR